MLYGHLSEIAQNLWVGKSVASGTILGTLGKFNVRHLHIEVHSYGSTIGYGIIDPSLVGPTGILRVGVPAIDIVPPFIYDLSQLLPNPVGYLPQDNGNLNFRDRVATNLLTSFGSSGGATIEIQINSTCSLRYRTLFPSQDTVLDEVDGYRAFVQYEDITRSIPSPLVQTIQP